MMEPETLQEAIIFFSNPDNCLDYFISHRWPDGVVCPTCGRDDVSFLANQKKWQCKSAHARRQFSIKTGTIFEDSPLGLDKWLTAMWLIVSAKNGISSYEIHRAIKITQKSAWFVLHRIRLAMQSGSIEKLSGTVECDETYIGGKSKNMHASKRKALKIMTGGSSKTAVMGIVQRRGRVKAKVIKMADTETLLGMIGDNVESGSTVMTDDHGGYRKMSEEYVHQVINHTVEYVRENVHTNSIENFWSLLKRTIKGTYVSVAPEHLQAYVEEQAFRYNEREGNDKDRFSAALKSVSGKRLTHAQLIGSETW